MEFEDSELICLDKEVPIQASIQAGSEKEDQRSVSPKRNLTALGQKVQKPCQHWVQLVKTQICLNRNILTESVARTGEGFPAP